MAEPKRFLITGGAGFIGSNAARRFAELGHSVVVFDNLSRAAAPFNLRWLQGLHPGIRFVRGDVQSEADVAAVLAEPFDAVVHLAGQVAVTTSITDPAADYGSNLLGTFRLLEGVRARYGSRPESAPLFLYASTNKVYGHIAGGEVLREGRWDLTEVSEGVDEEETLSFESPYGCSKGAADQYVVDYHRSFGLPTVSFRQSCLAADQPVLTPFGNKPISALRAGDFVHSGCGWTRVRHVWKTGVKPVRRLTTHNGLSIAATRDHRVRRPHGLFDNAGFAYGDFLAVLPESLHAPDWEPVPDTVLDPDAFLTAVGERTSDRRCLNEAERIAAELLPLTGDRLLAVTEVVGRLFGDGNLSVCHREARQNPSYQVQHYGSLKELSDLSQWLGWLGLPASAVVGSSSASTLPNGHIVRGTSYRIQQQTIPIFTLFEQLGVPVGDKVRVAYALPDWVTRGHRMVKRAFLRGFFGAELGRVCATSYLAPSFAQSKDVEFLDDGRAFVQQLRQLLEEFDIETSYFEGKPTTYQRGTTVQMTVRLLGGYRLYPRLAAIGYAFASERSQHLNELMRWSWTQTAPEHFEKTSELYRADGQLSWDSIGEIEELGETDVYDLEVENRSHLFVAGGVQVSNCIYGPRQFGEEDQGWVAWFALAAEFRLPIVIYGDGLQVRDLLWVDDLVAAYLAAVERKERVAGRAYNIGGGRAFRLSLQELLRMLEGRLQRPIPVGHAAQRLGDQRVFYCDISRARRELEWEPRVSPEEGVGRLLDWIGANRHEIASYLAAKGIPVAAS
jgi:nucleoside-diphosphate-sugar epimerase